MVPDDEADARRQDAEGERGNPAECATVGIDADTPVVLYCFKGARASNTLVALKEAGIKDVKLYFGSWNEWSRDPACRSRRASQREGAAAADGGRIGARLIRPVRTR